MDMVSEYKNFFDQAGLSQGGGVGNMAGGIGDDVVPSGCSLPNCGYNFFRSALFSSVPKLLRVMLMLRRSDSNWRISLITSDVGVPWISGWVVTNS